MNQDLVFVIDRIIRKFRRENHWTKDAYRQGYRMCLVEALEVHATVPQLIRLKPYVLRGIKEHTGVRYPTIEEFNDFTDIHGVRAALIATRRLIMKGPLPVIEPPKVEAMDQLRGIVAGVFAAERQIAV